MVRSSAILSVKRLSVVELIADVRRVESELIEIESQS